MSVFKVWSRDRSKRICVICNCSVDDVKEKASLKLGINGTHLCLESDGTLIDSDEILDHFSKETLILLQNFESWTPTISTTCDKDNNLNRDNFMDHENAVDRRVMENFETAREISENRENAEYDVNRPLLLSERIPRILCKSSVDSVIENRENDGSDINRPLRLGDQIPRIDPFIKNRENNGNYLNRRLQLGDRIPRINPVIGNRENAGNDVNRSLQLGDQIPRIDPVIGNRENAGNDVNRSLQLGDQIPRIDPVIGNRENAGNDVNRSLQLGDQIPRIDPVIGNRENAGNDVNRSLQLDDQIPRIDPVQIQESNINIWSNYQYDWSNLDTTYRAALRRGLKDNKLRTEVIQKVILQMRNISTVIPCAVLRSVAKQLVQQYPDSLEDRKGGKKFGNGYNNVYNSLLNRNNYETSLAKAKNIEKPKCKAKHLKFISQAKLGAVNWSLEDYPEGENAVTAEERRITLLDAFKLIKEHEGPAPPGMNEDILENIDKCFKDQRDFFNDIENLPTVESFLENWPILSLKKYMFHHYSLQMGHSIEQVKNGFRKDKDTIFAYGKAFNLTQAQTCEDSLEMIKIVFDYFQDDFSTFAIVCPPEMCWRELMVTCTGPCIIIVTEEEEDSICYQLLFDSTPMDRTDDFDEALVWAYATHFVWNRCYGKTHAYTFEFLQRHCLNLHPESGTKSSAKVFAKVNTFCNKLKKFSSYLDVPNV